uniref:YfhO family protein n=1 Tax=uncultured Actinomyces sp. TaxID=249061 RepID=UPI002637255B
VLFISLYFLALLFENVPFKRWRDQVAKVILFGAASVFGAALASALLIPVYLKLQHTSAYGDAWPDKLDFMYSPIDLFGRQMLLSEPAVREGLPNIFAGVLVLLLIPAYFLARSISTRAKIANGLLLAIMALSLSVNSLNFFWHGMHYPNQLNHRFAFTAVFLLVVMATDAFRALKDEPLPLAKIASGIGLLALVMYRIDKEAVTARAMVATIAVSALYVAVLVAFTRREEIALKLGKKQRVFATRAVAIATMIGLVSLELLGSSIMGIKEVRDGQVFGNRDGYAAGDFPRDMREVAAKIKAENDGYPRAELANRKTYNDAFLYGYDGVTLFGSSFSEEQLKLMEDVGLSTNGINSYAYNPAKPLDTFLGVKYVMTSDKEHGQLIDYPTYYESANLTVYENADALPVAFLVDSAAKDFTTGAEGYLTSQARMYEAAFGTSGLYKPVKADFLAATGSVLEQADTTFGQQAKFEATSEQAVVNVSVTAQTNGHYFLAYKSGTAKVQNVAVYTGNEQKVQVSTQKNGLVDLGVLRAGDTGRVEFKTEKDKSGTVSFEAGMLNDSVYERGIAKANANPVQIERGQRSMDISVNAPQAGYLLVSNIYDPGWEATVNGQSVTVAPFDDSLMLIPVQAGQNRVHMSFTPIGLRVGLVTNAIALGLLIGLVVFERRTRQRQLYRKHTHEASSGDVARVETDEKREEE